MDYHFTIPAGQVDLIRVALEQMVQQASALHAELARQAQAQVTNAAQNQPISGIHAPDCAAS